MIEAFSAIVGQEAVLTDPGDCWSYGYDNSRRHALPQAVLFAITHEQIRDIVRLCNREQIPLVARGTGTGTTGATVPDHGGIVLSLERMNCIIEIDPANRLARVEPGVCNGTLQNALAEQGFSGRQILPVRPSAPSAATSPTTPLVPVL